MSRRQGEHATSRIEADRTIATIIARYIATIIARYTVEPQEHLPLIHRLQQQHEQHLQSAPGWLSTSVLRGVEGTRVVAHLQVQKTDDDAGAAGLAPGLASVDSPFAACDVHQYTVDWITENQP